VVRPRIDTGVPVFALGRYACATARESVRTLYSAGVRVAAVLAIAHA
jgi:hypothetical protein